MQDEARQQGEIKAKLSASKAKVEQLTLRRRRLDEELAELSEQRALEHEHVGEARLNLQQALDAMATDTEQRELLLAQRDSLRERLDRVRQEARQHNHGEQQGNGQCATGEGIFRQHLVINDWQQDPQAQEEGDV